MQLQRYHLTALPHTVCVYSKVVLSIKNYSSDAVLLSISKYQNGMLYNGKKSSKAHALWIEGTADFVFISCGIGPMQTLIKYYINNQKEKVHILLQWRSEM